MKFSRNIKIIGSGPTGSLLALALAKNGCNIDIYDIRNEKELLSLNKVYAITHSSKKILAKIGLWSIIEPYVYEFTKLNIYDFEVYRNVILDLNDCNFTNKSEEGVGWIIRHQKLMELLLLTINQIPNINTFFGTYDVLNSTTYDFVVGADGTNSPSRRIWNIPNISYSYNQACLTAEVLIRGHIPRMAYEIFRKEGPLALLPVGDSNYQVVWTSSLAKCKERLLLAPSQLLDLLAASLPDNIQPDILITNPSVFPLRLSMALVFNYSNRILIGESAHSFHPVGGQGLNVCWRDVDVLASLINSSYNNRVMTRFTPYVYTINRLPDVIFMGVFTDFLLRLFSNRKSILLTIRRLLFILLRKYPILRKTSMRIMSTGAFTPFNFMYRGLRYDK